MENCSRVNINYPKLDGKTGYIEGYTTPIKPETIGRFTGIFDKNSKKIFEGDIVKAMMDYGPSGMVESIVEIYWDYLHGYQFEYFDISTIEVIGNIHDSPDLLYGE